MNSILSLWNSISALARALNRLASVADAVADEAERRIDPAIASGDTRPFGIEIPAEPAAEPARNGRRKVAAS